MKKKIFDQELFMRQADKIRLRNKISKVRFCQEVLGRKDGSSYDNFFAPASERLSIEGMLKTCELLQMRFEWALYDDGPAEDKDFKPFDLHAERERESSRPPVGWPLQYPTLHLSNEELVLARALALGLLRTHEATSQESIVAEKLARFLAVLPATEKKASRHDQLGEEVGTPHTSRQDSQDE